MNSMQYTIRQIPPRLDRALRAEAKRTGKSLNEVAREALARGLGVSARPQKHRDLDWFVGGKQLGTSFDKAQDWLDTAPNELL